MKNANAKKLLHPRTKDALYLGLFWLLVAAAITGSYLTTTHLITWTSQHCR